jgi:hypothetical protein
MRHDAQLRICHEKLGDDRERMPLWQKVRYPGRRNWHWCDLPAHAWCFDCRRYICEIHYIANHELHRTQLVSEE